MDDARQDDAAAAAADARLGRPRRSAMHALAADEFVRACRFRGDERVLEVGCGDGHATSSLSRGLAHGGRVVALEACPAARAATVHRVTKAASAEFAPVEVRGYDRQSLPLEFDELGAFDAVIVRHELQHADRPTELLAECTRALCANGRLLLVDDDFSTLRLTPSVEEFGSVWDLYTAEVLGARIDPRIGRRLSQFVGEVPELRTSCVAPLVFGGHAGDERFELAFGALLQGLRGASQALERRTSHVPSVLRDLSTWRRRADASLWYSAWFVEARRRVTAFFAMTP